MSTEQQIPDPVTDNAAYVRAVHDKGLGFDLRTMSRRKMLGGISSVFLLAACGSTSDSTSSGSSTTSSGITEIETETNGPYPADGTNGVDVRTESGIVRSDITSSFGDSTTTAEGVPLTIEFTITDLSGAPISGAAVYVWHCDRDGNYSLYTEGITQENYLRGIQATDANGLASFTSIYPACYSGRWPHIHFEVYSSVEDATSGEGTIRKTSQMAMPEDINDLVYATDGYSKSVSNLSQVTIADDNVFGDDDAATEMATATGSVSKGYVAKLTAAIDITGKDDAAAAPVGGEGQGGTPPGGPEGGAGGTPPSGAPQPTATASAS
ncbi:intradiol ring-cleavage dioxygenase [Kineosporia sp. NBRC 101731]|uniref:intradiol ring-cleavage dioxygenase n=1 Tax=Kineosporia sp. NBRC 101731 TaxID=3032199 RepID=UPI0024A00844|nr:intradiol ring-cleavage dioxygenase [Kineosporia sp. NBRC 101731]GLY32412.1 3,4-dioxygenase subunit beta [Kineosporia sp. NBRC 101731]